MTRSFNALITGDGILLNVLGVSLSLVLLAACGNDAGEASPPPAKAPTIADAYQATLTEGIQFGDRHGYPQFIAAASGMSDFEPGNRWTEGPLATFQFATPLPKAFVLDLEMTGAFGPNVGKPVVVTVGEWRGEFTVDAKPTTVKLRVETAVPAQSIAFAIPAPVSPKELGVSTDTRQVGVGFRRLRIVVP